MFPSIPPEKRCKSPRFGSQILGGPHELVNVQTLVFGAGSHYQG
jgi:hypothetical protein